MQGMKAIRRDAAASTCTDGAGECGLPCAGCPEAVASVSRIARGSELSRSDDDGCWVVRLGQKERLRSDDACLACSFFRNRAPLQAG
jgi:hypothetical protein